MRLRTGTRKGAEVREENPVVVIVETEGGKIAPLTFELLEAGAGLARKGGMPLWACLMGNGVAHLADVCASYADKVYVVDHLRLAGLHPDLYAHVMEALCSSLKPAAIIMGHTYENVEMAPKLACRLGSELIPDCAEVRRDEDGRFLCTKQVYGGNAIATFELPAQGIVTLRPKTYEAATPRQTKGEVALFTVDIDSPVPLSETLSVVEEESVNLGSAEVIVSGGRGASSPEAMRQLQKMVDLLKKRFEKVELGASRPLVDAGLVPHSRQIGQTGERVSPRVYFAVGISGATQHLTGMSGSKKVITVNKNEEAPIFKASDYGVVGLLEEVVPGFVRKLEELT
jgi:electron transfer flavoprotein alpha subunit